MSASEGGSGIVDGEEDQFSLTAGRYHLEVEDLYGCIAVYDTILTEPDEISTVVVTTNITCGAVGLDNGSIELSVTGGVAPYTYFWTDSVSFSSTDKDISNLGEAHIMSQSRMQMVVFILIQPILSFRRL